MKRIPDSIEVDGVETRIAARDAGDGQFQVEVGSRKFEVQAGCLADGGFWFLDHDGQRHRAFACATEAGLVLRVDGTTHVLRSRERDARGASEERGDPTRIVAPMTGTVVRVLCAVGDVVTKDQDLAVLSAMKMEHKLCALEDGSIRSIEVAEGATVDAGTLLISLELAAKDD